MGRPREMRGDSDLMGRRLSRSRSWMAGASLVAAVTVFAVFLSAQAGAVSSALPTVSISDVTLPEGGPEGTDTVASLPVTLSAASAAVVTVDWTTADGTADTIDYYAASGTVTFQPGDTAETVDVVIDGGVSPEKAEFFTVELSNATNATIDRKTGTVTILNDDEPPPPDPGEVNIVPAEGGQQCVALKDGSGCQPLEYGQQIQIENIAYINPKGGKVIVRSIVGIGTFYGGKFDVHEIGGETSSRATSAAQAKPILVVRLVGGKLKKQCGKTSRAAASTNAQAKEKPVRRLWGKGKGRFRTRGRYSSGTVRGTNWLTEDFCNGTQTRVVSGIVRVYDLVTKKFVTLKAGQTYFAKAGKTS